jgi:hypothetical protein
MTPYWWWWWGYFTILYRTAKLILISVYKAGGQTELSLAGKSMVNSRVLLSVVGITL